jgi:hypothetical protein
MERNSEKSETGLTEICLLDLDWHGLSRLEENPELLDLIRSSGGGEVWGLISMYVDLADPDNGYELASDNAPTGWLRAEMHKEERKEWVVKLPTVVAQDLQRFLIKVSSGEWQPPLAEV